MRNTLVIGVLFSSVLLHAQSVARGSSTMLVAHYRETSRMSAAGSMQPVTKGAGASPSIRLSTGVIGPTLISEPAFTLSQADFGGQDPGFERLVVSFHVDEHGRTRNVRVLKPVNPSVDERVRRAVRKYRFAPATLDNQKIAVEINMIVNFERR
jgi:TonB family protein